MKLSATESHSPPAHNAPAKARIHIQALDLVRGVAILGIVAVNANGLAAPIAAALRIHAWLFLHHG